MSTNHSRHVSDMPVGEKIHARCVEREIERKTEMKRLRPREFLRRVRLWASLSEQSRATARSSRREAAGAYNESDKVVGSASPGVKNGPKHHGLRSENAPFSKLPRVVKASRKHMKSLHGLFVYLRPKVSSLSIGILVAMADRSERW